MNYEHLKTIIDGQFSDWMMVKPHKMAGGGEVCRVTMPLLEPNGDVITVYLTERDGRFLVEDGGHIAGLLSDLSGGKPTQKFWNIVDRQLYHTGLKKNPATGIVYVEADESGLRYWMTEMAQLMAVLPHLLPEPSSPLRYLVPDENSASLSELPQTDWEVSKKLSELPQTVWEVSEKLKEVRFYDAIQFNQMVLGQAGIKRRVEFAYNTWQSGFGIGKAVYVLAFDLNVKNPLDKAGRKLAVANDLAWSTPSYSDWKVDVRLVYGLRPGIWEDAPEARLLTAAGEKSELSCYCWDDPGQQSKFIAGVSEDLSLPES